MWFARALVTPRFRTQALFHRRYSAPSSSSRQAYLESSPTKGVISLCLNRPESKNAISVQLLNDFRACLEEIQVDKSARVLLIRSSTLGAFCAGADLVERRKMSMNEVSDFLTGLRHAFTALENLPLPTIAAIDGPALGGGLELALACDIRVAGHTVAKIGLPEVRLGIIPGAGGTQRTARILGVSKAKDLIFSGRLLSAIEAKDLGLIDYVADEGTAYDRSVRLAEEISSGAPLALRAAKLAISRAPEFGLESGLDFERACYQPLLSTKDRLEALEAFKEKRKPVFRGE